MQQPPTNYQRSIGNSLRDAAGLILEHAADRRAAEEAIDEMPSALVTDRNGRPCTNAGVDWSNAPEGTMTPLPEDPDASERRIREGLEERTGADLAVGLADTGIPGSGTIDLAVGCSGIEAIDSTFGRTDLYGEPKIGGSTSSGMNAPPALHARSAKPPSAFESSWGAGWSMKPAKAYRTRGA